MGVRILCGLRRIATLTLILLGFTALAVLVMVTMILTGAAMFLAIFGLL